jgi:hypothetical protein
MKNVSVSFGDQSGGESQPAIKPARIMKVIIGRQLILDLSSFLYEFKLVFQIVLLKDVATTMIAHSNTNQAHCIFPEKVTCVHGPSPILLWCKIYCLKYYNKLSRPALPFPPKIRSIKRHLKLL